MSAGSDSPVVCWLSGPSLIQIFIVFSIDVPMVYNAPRLMTNDIPFACALRVIAHEDAAQCHIYCASVPRRKFDQKWSKTAQKGLLWAVVDHL
jgi:hypothetical protein